MGTLPRALRAVATRRASSMVPSSRASQPSPPSGVEQFGMLVALRFHGVGSWYAMLKQSKKTPSIIGASASGATTLSMKKSH